MKKGLRVVFRYSVLALVLPIGAAHLAGCDAHDKTTDVEHVAKAKDFKLRGNLQASVIELKNALEKNPDNAEARTLLGQLSLLAGNGAAAEKELRRAVDLGVAKDAILIPLAEALRLQGKNQELVTEIVPPAALGSQDQARLLAYRGDAWLAMSKADQARQEYELALQSDPGSALATLGLAKLAYMQKEIDKALEMASRATELDPKEGAAWSFLGEIYGSKDDLAKAEESFGKAIENRLDNGTDLAHRALVRISLNKLDGAKEDIVLAQKHAGTPFLVHYAEGLLEFHKKRYSEAAVALEKAVKENPDYLAATYYLGLSYLMKNDLNQAESRLSRVAVRAPGWVPGLRAMALLKFRSGDNDAAAKTAQALLSVLPKDVFSLKMMANIEFARGAREKGLEYLIKAAQLEPGDEMSQIQLGTGYLAGGHRDEGLSILEQAAAGSPEERQAELYIVAAHIQARDFEKALAAVAKLKEKLPEDAMPLALEGTVHMAQGDLAKARAAFEAALKKSPGDLTAGSNLASIALLNNRLDEARRLYRQILEKHPDHLDTLLKLAELDMREGKLAETEAGLNRIVERYPNELRPRLILARYYLRFGQPRKSEELLKPIRDSHAGNPEMLAMTAEVQLALKEFAEGLKTARTLAEAMPKSALAQYTLAQAYAANGDRPSMRAALEQAARLNPKFLPARLALVRALLTEQKMREAEDRLSALQKEYPATPEVMALRGDYLMREKRPKEAAGLYRDALEKLPGTALVSALARAQWQAGEKNEALATLERWSQAHPNDIDIYLLRSGLYTILGRTREARAQWKKVLELDRGNAVAMNELAWSLRKEDPAAALEYAERAATLAPKAAPVQDTLAMILMEKAQPERALNVAIRAHELAPQAPAIHYHLALAQENGGRHDEAVRTLQELLLAHRDFEERAEAEALLKRLTSAPATP